MMNLGWTEVYMRGYIARINAMPDQRGIYRNKQADHGHNRPSDVHEHQPSRKCNQPNKD
jgi:hypothetical protein